MTQALKVANRQLFGPLRRASIPCYTALLYAFDTTFVEVGFPLPYSATVV